MATWIAHLRVAENLLKEDLKLNKISFIVGNIGPDSGVPNEDWSSFQPPKTITHWKDKDNKINPENFYNKYLYKEDLKILNDRISFLIGYYVHLLTDVEWNKFFKSKKSEPGYNKLEEDPNFIWEIKNDWYGLDYIYLDKHPESIFYKYFQNIHEVPDYLDYFPSGAFSKQVKYITDFYLGENNETKEDFKYLKEDEMDTFIVQATENIYKRLYEIL